MTKYEWEWSVLMKQCLYKMVSTSGASIKIQVWDAE